MKYSLKARFAPGVSWPTKLFIPGLRKRIFTFSTTGAYGFQRRKLSFKTGFHIYEPY